MASPASSHDRPPTVIKDLQQTPNSKTSKSKIKGWIQRRVLFPLEPHREQQDHRHQRDQPQQYWTDVEVGALSVYISQENDRLVQVARKDMEFWDRAAVFIQQQAKTVHCRTGEWSLMQYFMYFFDRIIL